MSGKSIEINQAEWKNEVLGSDVPVLVELWAKWCAPCMMIDPILDDIAEEFEGRLKVARVDTETYPAVLEENAVMSIPALLLFKNGEVVTRMTGYKPKEKIISKILEHI